MRRFDALLRQPGLAAVFDAIGQDGDDIWLVGGCVRNAVLREPLGDLDLATQATPDSVMARAKKTGLKAIPTGIDHGTVTLISDGVPFEVTSLRKDVETDGRRAVVAFTRDLAEDAARRDFTMNALYVDRSGDLHDPLAGLADLEARRVRFIGEACERITEDYLRTLRYFRFYGWYGHGAPDRDAVRAIVSTKAGLATLSAERVWSELKKLLAAPNITRSLLWMRQTGVYQIVLPESGDMDGFARFMRVEQACDLAVDPMLRLLALLPLFTSEMEAEDRLVALGGRLKLSGAERARLIAARAAYAGLSLDVLDDDKALRAACYTLGKQALCDGLVLKLTHSLDVDPEADLPAAKTEALGKALDVLTHWTPPKLPVSGKDMVARGIPAGPQVGEALKIMEGAWVASDFAMDRDALLAVMKS